MTELPDTLTGLQHALAHGAWSVEAAVEVQQQRLARLGPQLHCIVQALNQRQADVSRAPGTLSGIALAHKDIFNLPGWRPGIGFDGGAPSPGLQPATAVARLMHSGAAHMATLAMAEYACGATAANPNFPRCVNPLRSAAVVGGSSSGSAVAVAAGLVYGSLGTDTAGSVRIPAASCGVLGLKTTHGRVPRDGVFPLAPSLDSVGILTRSAADAVQLLDVVAPMAEFDMAPVRSLRVRAWIPGRGVDPQVAAALEAFLPELDLVQRLDDWADFKDVARRAEIVLHTEAARVHATQLHDGSASPAVRDIALPGLVLPPSWHAAALADRGRHALAFVRGQLADCDLFLLPALAHPVPDWSSVQPGDPSFDARQLAALHRFMGWVNYLGLPSIVVPIAADARGMPICVQAVARPFGERSLLVFADGVQSRRFDGGVFTRQFSSGN
jgi:Asp-tRNA(Asn)/Glu-tRNA(Gln) amidotransferase A subunit family amidase